MKKLITVILPLLFFSTTVSQTFLVIDLYRPFGMKRIRVYPDEMMVYKTKSDRGIKKNTIAGMINSTIFFVNGDSVQLNNIKVIKTGRSNRITRAIYKAGIQGGIFLICIDGFNHLITSDPGIVDERIAKVASGMLLTGCVVRLLSVRRIHPGKNKILKIIDLGVN